MTLGTSWGSVVGREGGAAVGQFSLYEEDDQGVAQGDQIFLYCRTSSSTTDEGYNVIAAFSTTGSSFDPPNMFSYERWQSALPWPLREHEYSVLMLPSDAAMSGNGYKYTGPIFVGYDLNAKALINVEEYWQAIPSSSSQEAVMASLILNDNDENQGNGGNSGDNPDYVILPPRRSDAAMRNGGTRWITCMVVTMLCLSLR
jgi:hypothetical protein